MHMLPCCVQLPRVIEESKLSNEHLQTLQFLAMPSCVEALSSRSHALEPMLHVQFVRSNAMQPCTALHSLLLSI